YSHDGGEVAISGSGVYLLTAQVVTEVTVRKGVKAASNYPRNKVNVTDSQSGFKRPERYRIKKFVDECCDFGNSAYHRVTAADNQGGGEHVNCKRKTILDEHFHLGNAVS
ncbi:hypothetical protein PF008_g33281, partial [Phytophthora fragariae]